MSPAPLACTFRAAIRRSVLASMAWSTCQIGPAFGVRREGGQAALPESAPRGAAQRVSSPVAAHGRVYVTGREGITPVVKSGPAFVLLASTLGDEFDASPELAHSELFPRGRRSLYAIASP